jgi:hypothetical protein
VVDVPVCVVKPEVLDVVGEKPPVPLSVVVPRVVVKEEEEELVNGEPIEEVVAWLVAVVVKEVLPPGMHTVLVLWILAVLYLLTVVTRILVFGGWRHSHHCLSWSWRC